MNVFLPETLPIEARRDACAFVRWRVVASAALALLALFPLSSRAEDCWHQYDSTPPIPNIGGCYQTWDQFKQAQMKAADDLYRLPYCYGGYDGYCFTMDSFTAVPNSWATCAAVTSVGGVAFCGATWWRRDRPLPGRTTPYVDTFTPAQNGFWFGARLWARCAVGEKFVVAAGTCLPIEYLDRVLDQPSCRADPGKGQPIYPLRGVEREPLGTGYTVGRLNVAFTYDSTPLAPRVFQTSGMADSEGTTISLQAYGPIGNNWSVNVFKALKLSTRSTSSGIRPSGAKASRGGGTTVTLSQNVSTGAFTAPVNRADRLVAIAGGYRYYDGQDNTIETYGSDGAPVRIDWADGSSVVYTYSDANTPSTIAPAGYVIGIADNFGRALNFTWAAWPSPILGAQLKSISDANGRLAMLSVEASGNLSAVQWADGAIRTFLYENNPYGALTGITDELNQRYATFGYNSSWLATSTELAGGVNRYSASYSSAPYILVTEEYDAGTNTVFRYQDWQLPQGTVVTDPLGSTSTWAASSLIGKNYLTSQSQPAGSGCSASSSALSYDANGNVASADDFNGRRTCYVSELSRNLETVRVQGLANTQACSGVTGGGSTLPVGSTKVSTQWHPEWSLEVKRAEPGRITTSVYNGQPDPFDGGAVASCAPSDALLPDGKPIAVVCKRVEQATTDGDGSQGFAATLQSAVARVQQWSYNRHGQVLTAKDALNNTTTYAYYADTSFTGADPNAVGHTLGDLKSVTNAKGQVTSYTAYDKNGRLLQSTDANGVVTSNAYDARGRLLSTSVGGQSTGYTYDAAGQLTRVTNPDGSWIGYEYDAAHRNTAVKDNVGNRIEYTLDNAGNKTAQSVKDPAGNLARAMSRSIDALGRVQQQTGRE